MTAVLRCDGKKSNKGEQTKKKSFGHDVDVAIMSLAGPRNKEKVVRQRIFSRTRKSFFFCCQRRVVLVEFNVNECKKKKLYALVTLFRIYDVQ